MPIVRITCALVALIVCAWFGLAIRQTHALDAATALVSQSASLTAAQGRHADSLLETAGRLNPDRQVDIVRAQVALARGDRRGAEAILGRVVHSEPRNVLAWQWVARAAPNPQVFSDALAVVGSLVPKVPPPP